MSALMWLLGSAWAGTIVVDASGGGDYTDLGEAIDAAVDGDRVEVRAGTYPLCGARLLGQDFTIVGDGPDQVEVVDGCIPEASVWLGLHETGGETLVEGLSFVGNPGTQWWPVELNGSAGAFTIRDCRFSGFEVGLSIGALQTTVDGCVFHDNYYGLSYSQADYLVVQNSIFVGQSIAGMGGYWSGYPAGYIDIRYNTFVDNSSAILDEATYSVTVNDNIIVGADWSPFWFPSYVTEYKVLSHNLFWDNELRECEYGASDLGEDNTEADPLFVAWSDDGDWSNDDLRLQEGSPAIDLGWLEQVDTDLDGTPRPLDGDGDGEAVRDVGAYEWARDADGDGYMDEAMGGPADSADCDDDDASVYPGADEVCGDGIDQDCDGADTECDDTGNPDTGGADTGGPDTGGADSGAPDSGQHTADSGEPGKDCDGGSGRGCGCAATSAPRSLVWALLLGGLVLRRRAGCGLDS